MNTKALRQKILDLAIHGKLVPQDPNDEPASVLLERIRAEKERLIKEGKIKRPKKTKATSDKPHYENVPFEVPDGWCWSTIEELLINRDGERKPVSSAIRSKQKNKVYNYYGAAGIIDKVDGFIFDERLLLIGEDGANLLSRSKDNAFFAEGKYWVNNHAHVLDATDKDLLDFVALVINAMKLDDYITGSAQPKLSQDNLNKIPIALPPLQEQIRIVKELNHWFSLVDCIECNKDDLQNIIKQTKSKILDLAIHGKLVPQDPTDEPAAELLKRINPKAEITCDNGHYQKLPEGWAVCCLENVAEVLDNLRKPINSNERNSRIANKHESELFPYYGATGQVGFIDDYLIDGKFLLLGEDGAPFLDKYAIKSYPIKGKCWVNNHAHILKPLCDFDYLMYYLNHVDYKDYVNGSTRLKLTQSDMRSIKILLPPLTEQKRISVKIKYLFRLLDSIACNL